jgi:hypothetical protein
MAFNRTPAYAPRFSRAPVGGRRLTCSLGVKQPYQPFATHRKHLRKICLTVGD